MGLKVGQRRAHDGYVIAQIPDADVAVQAQQPSDALTATALASHAASVVMVDVPGTLATRIAGTADGALAILLGQKGFVAFECQAVPAQVQFAGVPLVLAAVDSSPFARILRKARTAIWRSRARELTRRLLMPASSTCARCKLSLPVQLPVCACLPRVLIRAVDALRAGLHLVDERVIANRAGALSYPHSYRIHAMYQGMAVITQSERLITVG